MGQIGEKRRVIVVPKPNERPQETPPQTAPVEPAKQPETVPV